LSKFIPEAIFCANDYMAAGAIKYLHERKIDVPRDIAVVGYDNNDISVGLFPSLTTVDNRFEDLGEALAKGLLALIDGTRASVQCLVRPVLIKRQSHLWTPRKSVGRLMEKVNN
jgi:DNA-binding LacI/PurR family transcriptional regulator